MSRPNSNRAPSSSALEKHAHRFQELKLELEQIGYFCKGTVLKRMTKCGRTYCACATDRTKRHGPYFELTYKLDGKTVNVRLSPEAAPLYKAASTQFRKLKATLNRLEKISQAALKLKAQSAQSK